MNLIGDVDGKTAIIIDDMVDTAGTLTAGIKMLKDKGAKAVYASCSHGYPFRTCYRSFKSC